MVLLNERIDRIKDIFVCFRYYSDFAFFAFMTWSVDVTLTDLDDDEKKIAKLFKTIIITSFISILVGVFIPSKETYIEMMIASQVTHENVAATKEEIYELVDYVTEKVRSDE